MAGRRKRTREPRPVAAPGTLAAALEEYLDWSQVLQYSPKTVQSRRHNLRPFNTWCEERGITKPGDVTRPILQRYQRHLYHYRQRNGKPLTWGSQRLRLVNVRGFFRWLTRQNYILYNPASDLELPREMRKIPRTILSASEAETVINQPDIDEPLGVRDRAILETLYSTGMRRFELVRLELYDLNREQGVVLIREGKGRRDRMIPIGDRAMAWIEKYLTEVRPYLVVEPDRGALFLSAYGEGLKPVTLSKIVRDYVEAANLGKRGSCHLFRHTMATLMLDNGADIRHIQEMLGHAVLSTTQIYTQVSIRKLKQVHSATHPARLERPAAPAAADDDEPTAEDVLEILELEAAEDDESEDDAARPTLDSL